MSAAQEDDFRPLSDAEHELLSALVSVDFAGHHALAAQLAHVSGRRIDAEGSLALSVSGAAPAQVQHRVPVEGMIQDTDGVLIHVLLHVVDGFMNELEIFREDSGPILRSLSSDDMRLLAL